MTLKAALIWVAAIKVTTDSVITALLLSQRPIPLGMTILFAGYALADIGAMVLL